MFVAYHRPYLLEDVRQSIGELAALVHESPDVLFTKIHELVPEYRPFQSSDATVDANGSADAPRQRSPRSRSAPAAGADAGGRAAGDKCPTDRASDHVRFASPRRFQHFFPGGHGCRAIRAIAF